MLLKNGDVINLYGYKIILVFGVIIINNPFGNLKLGSGLSEINLAANDEIESKELEDIEMYSTEDYFLKSPRLRRIITTFNMNVDSPPQKENFQEMPLIYTLGPMLTMGASSIINLTNSLTQINDGEKTLKESLPTLVVSIAMLMSMLVWPFLTRMYEKRRKKRKEKTRRNKYLAYLKQKETELETEYNNQISILNENLLSNEMCYDIILNKRRTLWERKIEQSDFLTVRVGNGQLPFDAKINHHAEDFTMEDDDLKQKLNGLVEKYSVINNVPIGYSLSENNITAVNGIYPKYISFVNNIFLQLFAYHSYDELKIVVFTNDKNQERWKYLKKMPYCFSDDKQIRFFATNTEEMQDISEYLTQVFQNRKVLLSSDNGSQKFSHYSKFKGYYLILVDDIDMARKIGIIENVLEEKNNLGFSLLILEEKLSKIPSECNNFLIIGNKTSGILKNDVQLGNEQTKFIDEIINNFDMEYCSYVLSNVPIYIENKQKSMPESVTFLELFGVGQVEQLNSLNRWKDNVPTKSLKVEIGYNENGDPFVLDLHEKYHGPHGLIAGMTGSGKSEFIITYVLSMAVNYSPEEVAFVLVDYKGGGLAGAFENSELGLKLPHVVGTITNLDKAEINRALSSIDSELRRRQKVFNEVREKTGESTIDIYKYQRMYRDGIVTEPIPHLVIVCDEFAELKTQQPEFMENLISTARIGRSLGVHLILATQKPSGVVDAQIWSNSKFKICLKVQDKADSMEMIKCADAAELKTVGRFYLQVGYNEYFALGQSAWAGAPYYPRKEYKKVADKNLYFINNVGLVNKMIDNSQDKKNLNASGEELSAVLKYLINIGKEANLNIRQLWLERIPNDIFIGNLMKKYNFTKEQYNINPIIGEYDDPSEQKQGLLTLPITKEGNTLLYGMSDSGKDEFLQTLVYSLITTYDTNEINLYLLDFGAETLMNYIETPQVGDVILNGDDEKIENFVKMITVEMNKRKKMFMSYNGNYQDYIKMSGNTLPNIIVLINSIEVITEVYADLTEKMTGVIREGAKYGINFIVTTTSQNSIRFKIAQCFKQLICLQMNNESEYRDILGKTEGLVPFKCLGRGLVKLDRICEFQTASIATNEHKLEVIKTTIEKLKQNGLKKAKKVPIMPEIVTFNRFIDKYNGINSIPLGLSKESLSLQLYDFSKNVVNVISSNEFDNIKRFMNNFVSVLEKDKENFGKIIIDANNFFEKFNYTMDYQNNKFNEFIDLIKEIDDQNNAIFNSNNMNIKSLSEIKNKLCIIIGLEKFISKLDEEHKNKFIEILNHNKEMLKINFIFIDIPSGFKNFEYEDWFKKYVSSDAGIWLGSGITQQYVLKILIQPSGISSIDNEHIIVLKSGMPTIVKYINEIK